MTFARLVAAIVTALLIVVAIVAVVALVSARVFFGNADRPRVVTTIEVERP